MATVTKAAINKAQVLMHKVIGGTLSTAPAKQGYNAYVLAMLMAPGTQAMHNLAATAIAKDQGNATLVLPPKNMHPSMHMASATVRKYHAGNKNGVGVVCGVSFNTLAPRCTTHGGSTTKCTATCLYGFYVVAQNAWAHNLLAPAQQAPQAPQAPPSA